MWTGFEIQVDASTELMDITEAYVKFARQTDAEKVCPDQFNGSSGGNLHGKNLQCSSYSCFSCSSSCYHNYYYTCY